ncbi:MAG: ParA family protein, partial [Boseongicola sp. SB0677_bin_26]|nr:ParA family protein [Boseongicola sp. SB0665_bin_10]MYG24937.1 ParA family protein [Boseongicola sp. SB0677_bin_26]
MPVVTVASPKGGAGKSTAAVLLATELARAGAHAGLSHAIADLADGQQTDG